MADVHDKKTRSYNMSQIKGRDTKPEMVVKKYLHRKGLRYRLHDRKLPGKPDLVLRKYNTAVFINGCFWHGHEGCSNFKLPKTRSDWWKQKIEGNVKRDEAALNQLDELGWRTIVVWECELKAKNRDKTLNRIYQEIITENTNEEEKKIRF